MEGSESKYLKDRYHLLIKAGLCKINVYILKKKLQSCLACHCSFSRNHLKVVQFLLDQGADIIVTKEYGNSPLHGAATEGHEEVIRILLKRGTDSNLTVRFFF